MPPTISETVGTDVVPELPVWVLLELLLVLLLEQPAVAPRATAPIAATVIIPLNIWDSFRYAWDQMPAVSA
jgi:hypothetical protein